MVGAIGCRCIACGPVWMQMVVDAGEGKEIRKMEERKKEKKKKETYSVRMDGGHDCVRTHCMRMGCDANKGTKKRKETHKCGWWTQLRADALHGVGCGRG